MTTIDISQLDIVYLSYDEPNAEANWLAIQEQCPRALRVHGIKGSDAAHKACAELATGERFITIDGDNRVNPEFFQQQISIPTDLYTATSVLSFSSENVINGLVYGNGGIKCWPRQVVLDMQTHEQADSAAGGVDFCWVLDYILMPGCWSRAAINATAHQAWRAGFREGVKFTLTDGLPTSDSGQWIAKQARVNLDRLSIWTQVGADVDKGLWAVLGARAGVYYHLFTDWDPAQLQDFDHLDWLWEQKIKDLDPWQESCRLGELMLDSLALPMTRKPLTAEQSRWFKQIHPQPVRTQAKRMRQ